MKNYGHGAMSLKYVSLVQNIYLFVGWTRQVLQRVVTMDSSHFKPLLPHRQNCQELHRINVYKIMND